MMENIALISAAAGAIGLVIAFMLYQQVNKVKIDNETVADITDEIQKGAMAFLFAEYRVLAVFCVAVGAVLAFTRHLLKACLMALLVASCCWPSFCLASLSLVFSSLF